MQEYKRWYDFDPNLQKVINILKDYQDELKEQAEAFLAAVEKKVSKETLDKYYEMAKPLNGGKRWYDKDPVISKTIELLRVIPQQTQKQTAQTFMQALRDSGVKIDE